MFFMSPANKFKEDAGDKLTVYHPYPRKPDCLTICGYYNKGSTVSSVV